MRIYLPHLHYTVYVKRLKQSPPALPNAKAYVERIDDHSCAMFIGKKENAPNLAHELIHVLQFIADSRNLDMVREWEHMGYLMGYLLGKILGYKYDV